MVTRTHHTKKDSLAVLASGGLDSSVLLAWSCRSYRRVYPVFVEAGLRWEDGEKRCLGEFLRASRLPGIKPLSVLRMDCSGLYARHWALEGKQGVPGARAPDASVYIPGRNLLTLSQACVLCVLRRIDAAAIGILNLNPFADATPKFFRSLEAAVNQAMGRRVAILAPFRRWDKVRVIRWGMRAGLPLEHTLSCMAPKDGSHCWACQKCAEREKGFARAGIEDPARKPQVERGRRRRSCQGSGGPFLDRSDCGRSQGNG